MADTKDGKTMVKNGQTDYKTKKKYFQELTMTLFLRTSLHIRTESPVYGQLYNISGRPRIYECIHASTTVLSEFVWLVFNDLL